MINIRDRKAEKELDCKLEYDLIDTEEAYHISHRFPKRFAYLTDYQRWHRAIAVIHEHELEMRDLGRGMTYREYELYRSCVMSRFKVPKEWW